MKAIIVIVILALGALLLWMASASAQSMCGPYTEFVKAITGSQYGETSRGKGISGGGNVVVELFSGKETFTILATSPASGRTCVIAAGKGWVAGEAKPIGDEL